MKDVEKRAEKPGRSRSTNGDGASPRPFLGGPPQPNQHLGAGLLVNEECEKLDDWLSLNHSRLVMVPSWEVGRASKPPIHEMALLKMWGLEDGLSLACDLVEINSL